MQIKKRLAISFYFLNSTAEHVKSFYEKHKYSHNEIYLAGVEALKKLKGGQNDQ